MIHIKFAERWSASAPTPLSGNVHGVALINRAFEKKLYLSYAVFFDVSQAFDHVGSLQNPETIPIAFTLSSSR